MIAAGHWDFFAPLFSLAECHRGDILSALAAAPHKGNLLVLQMHVDKGL